jgi:tripeptide aminopeptidase
MDKAMIDIESLLQRFLRYVQVDTTAREGQDEYPSSPGQLELGRMLRDELLAIGLKDAVQTPMGIVLATLPATVQHAAPIMAWNSHVDTSPETTGKNVRPQVIRNYQGGDIPLPANPDAVIRVSEDPELNALIGKTLITTDGTTLLGADDKAGVAVIMQAVATLVAHPEIPHGPIRVCFTCDEEIGHGVDHVDLREMGATVCYTLDGQGANEIDVETFSADLATISVRGVNVHPAIAKGRMVNALRAVGSFLDRLPRDMLAPEVTAGREGFLHPYTISGGVGEVVLRVLLRDFETAKLNEQADLLRQTAVEVERDYPGTKIEIVVTPQYRNMAEGLAREPRAAEFAKRAVERMGRTPKMTIVRGGTDGSRFTELGLPTPNLSTGQHHLHSRLEWACLEEMEVAVGVLIELAQLWGAERA